MRKLLFLLTVTTGICVTACHKTNVDLPLSKKMIGNWLVVGTGNFRYDSGITVEWGVYYVNKIGINADSTFTVDQFATPDGVWKLKGKDTIVFYTDVNSGGMNVKDTSEFKLSVNDRDELLLSSGQLTFTHKRISN